MKYDSYIICTSPRSGSTLLCQLLSQTRVAGVPNSYFHTPNLDSWRVALGLDQVSFPTRLAALTATLHAAKLKGTGNTGTFGLRVQQGSFEYLTKQLAIVYPDNPTTADLFQAAFGKTLFIYLRRENTLEQAISCVKAMQTGLWHRSSDGSEFERLSPPQKLTFDASAIHEHIDEFSQANRAWQAWFKTQSIYPLEITYEELAKDPSLVLKTVIGKLGLEHQISPDAPLPLAKLADQTNALWAKQYLQTQNDQQSDQT